jgi:hypothetical protein
VRPFVDADAPALCRSRAQWLLRERLPVGIFEGPSGRLLGGSGLDPRNIRSKHVPERLGFVFEGTLRNSVTDNDGLPSDRYVYALIPQDYVRLEWATRSVDS